MAEFVEFSLERLLPVFENLKVSKLFTAGEVDELIRRCRRYEYLLSKRAKECKDYHDYADLILQVLAEVRARRERERYFNRHESIEKELKYKGACLHRFCSDRFKDEFVFRKQIDYLLKVNLLGKLSEAYTKLLQLYGQNARYHEEAGRFEFAQNRSAENARAILHGALRKFPRDVGLWAALFEVEIGYAKFILRRVERLQGAKKRKHSASGNDDDDVKNKDNEDKNGRQVEDNDSAPAKETNIVATAPVAVAVGKEGAEKTSSPQDQLSAFLSNGQSADGVLALRLADLVCAQASDNLPDDRHRAEFLYRAWRVAKAAGDLAAQKATALFESLAQISPPVEESVLARCERDEKVSGYDLFDLALERMRTERMVRLYIDFCDSRRTAEDVFAPAKLAQLLGELDALGVAVADDYARLFALFPEDGGAGGMDAARYERVLRHALEKTPADARLWERLLAVRTRAWLDADDAPREDAPQFAELKALADEALSKIAAADSLGVWRRLLELACAVCGAPKKLERIFSRAFSSAPPKIAAELRTIRLEYLAEATAEGDDDDNKNAHRAAYKQMANVRPTALSLHLKFVGLEEARGADKTLIEGALENAIVEFGASSAECWLKYLRFALANSPQKVGQIHKRALANLQGDLLDEFLEKWTLASQEAAAAK